MRVQNLCVSHKEFLFLTFAAFRKKQPLLFFYYEEIMPKSKPIESFESGLTIGSRGKVIYDRSASIRQFSEITFTSFAALK